MDCMTKIPFFSMIAGKAVCPLKILKIYVRPSSPASREKQESPNGRSIRSFVFMRPAGLEPATSWSEAKRSIH